MESLGFEVRFIGRKIKGIENVKLPFRVDRLNCWINSGFLFYLEFNIRLLLKLLGIRNSILLSVDPDTLLANWICKIIKGNPLVIDMHEWFVGVPELQNHPIKQKLWVTIERIGINASDARYTVNKSIANLYFDRYGYCLLYTSDAADD